MHSPTPGPPTRFLGRPPQRREQSNSKIAWPCAQRQDAAIFKKAVDDFLLHHAFLGASLAQKHGLVVFNVVPKAHQLHHLGTDFKFVNSRLLWSYSWENFTSRVACMARASTAATPLHAIARPVLERYRELMQLRFEKRARC